VALDITDWNLNPNQVWFVKITDAGGGLTDVEVFNTKADMDASTNRVAFALGQTLMDMLNLDLTQDSTPPLLAATISKFNPSLDFHFIITEFAGPSPDKKFKVGPFTDLKPVEDAMLLTEQMIDDRATLEINRGTHSALMRRINLKSHFPALEEGDIISLSSTKRGLVSVKNRIDSVSIDASIDNTGRIRFLDAIEVVEFVDFVRTC